jgi:hypothetical protein
VLAPQDPRIDSFLDVIEDHCLLDNRPIRRRKPDYDPARDWFDHAGFHYQAGYMLNSLIDLRRDDVPNFLRAFYNQYASQIIPGEYTFREHSPVHPVHDKIFEEAAFLERLRSMLVMEDGTTLWLARGTQRAWLAPGQKVAIHDAPTAFGPVSYTITGEADGRIVAAVSLPARRAPGAVELRLRQSEARPLRAVTVNGQPWTAFDARQEVIHLGGLSGEVRVEARY